MFGRKSGSKSAKKAAKAEKKAAKKAAELEKKAEEQAAGAAAKAERAAAKDAKSAKKAAKSADAKAAKQAKQDVAAAKRAAVPPPTLLDRVTNPKDLRRMIAGARIVGPVVAPFALQAATTTRGWWDERRARQLGVTALEVAAYRGPTGPTEARLAGLAQSLEQLQRRRGGDLQVVRFAEVTNNRLADLTIATRAAASMPSSRRRATLNAIGRDLDRIDADLMTFLLPNTPAA